MFRLNGSGELAGAPRHWATGLRSQNIACRDGQRVQRSLQLPDNRSHFKDSPQSFVVVCLVWNLFTFRFGYRGRGKVRGRAAPASCLRHLSTRSPFSARSIQPPGSARLRLFSKQTAVIFSFIVAFEKKLFFFPLLLPVNARRVCLQKGVGKSERRGVEGGAGGFTCLHSFGIFLIVRLHLPQSSPLRTEQAADWLLNRRRTRKISQEDSKKIDCYFIFLITSETVCKQKFLLRRSIKTLYSHSLHHWN